ncbi:MAG: trypsin-like peptidase domain-containing protein [Flavobacteriales bacterium]|nr:trypsin-like peptidase domain-containing protein [Flavobacteriales bacterium]
MKRQIGTILLGMAGAFIALAINHRINTASESSAALATNSTPSTPVTYVSLPSVGSAPVVAVDFTEAAERSVNAVVHVTTETTVNVRDPFADFFWGYRAPSQQRQQQGAGSGVIISPDGYIVTNNHVVEGADRIKIHMNDRRQFDARIVGRDPSTDIAVLKVDGQDLSTLDYGNSDEVRVGEWVLAVGNPMNLTSTVTAGIVSAKARNINLLQYDPSRDVFPIESFIQTDAAVNPGNSGGALVTAKGQLVGIKTAIAGNTGQYTGYSFAVPVNIVKKVAGDIVEYGSVQRAYLGVSIRDMDQALAKELALDRPRGVYVNGLTDGGAAADAGLEKGDVITRVGSITVNNVPQLQEQVGKFKPGDRVPVTVLRSGNERVVELVLRGREGNVTATKARNEHMEALGAELSPASAEELGALRLKNGVKVSSVNGGKFRSGIREGFIITRIDQQPVSVPADVEKALSGKRGGVLVEGVYPNGTKAYYGLGL